MNISYTSATSDGWLREGLRENPGTVPHGVRCDNGYFGIAWVPTDAPGPPAVVVGTPPDGEIEPFATLDAILGIVPLPPITVGANPDTGLVALPSWYWVEGYGGETLAGSETLDGTTVEVEVWPDRYEWTFGDGHGLTTTSLGAPYPAESDIQHTYEQSSLSQGGAFEVRLDIVFHGRFRVITEEEDEEGELEVVVGDWEGLDPITRSFARPYPVQQLQSVLAAGQ